MRNRKVRIFGENEEQLEAKVANGGNLASLLVDHLNDMGASRFSIQIEKGGRLFCVSVEEQEVKP